MTRRIVIINAHAPTLDAREGIRKVPAHALRQGDVTSANGERVVSVQRAVDSANHVDVVLAKSGLRRYLQWHRNVLVGVAARDVRGVLTKRLSGLIDDYQAKRITRKQLEAEFAKGGISKSDLSWLLDEDLQKDGVGSPEEVAYGEGWHSTQRGSPYGEPLLIAAWERGRKAKQQQSKMISGYFRGEVRGKRFDPPRVRQVDSEEVEFHVTCNMVDPAAFTTAKHVSKTVKVKATDAAQAESKAIEFYRKRGYRNIKVVATQKFGANGGSRDFKSEKGYVARLIDVRTGGTLAHSEPHISNGAGLKAWIQGEARKLIAQGKLVKAEVGIEFYDPNLIHDALRKFTVYVEQTDSRGEKNVYKDTFGAESDEDARRRVQKGLQPGERIVKVEAW